MKYSVHSPALYIASNVRAYVGICICCTFGCTSHFVCSSSMYNCGPYSMPPPPPLSVYGLQFTTYKPRSLSQTSVPEG